MIAINAQPIIDARLRGFKPDGMILVSLCGHVEVENHVVRAIPGNVYDWRWVRDLDICAYIADRNDWFDTLKAIAKQRPGFLNLWNCFEHWGAKVYLHPAPSDIGQPVRKWSFDLDFLPWLDFQNEDFIECRTYTRTLEGMPYAANT